jgi:mevalonate kinase
MKTVVSVPGKIFLMGEHAAVYGKPALLSAINLRMKVKIEDQIAEARKLKAESKIIVVSSEPDDYVKKICDLVFQKYNIGKIPALKISIDSAIPAGYHLGSSAATAVGVVGAVVYHTKKLWNPMVTNQLAYAAEKLIHGNPSGGDNTIVSSGGMIWYRKEFEFLKSIWQMPFKYPEKLNNLYLFDTGRPKETTGEMVSFVRSRFTAHSLWYRKIFDQNECETKNLALAIKNSSEVDFIQAMINGENTLEKMGVVSPKAKKIIRIIEEAGGAAKILGGGGRQGGVGYLLCYLPENVFKKIYQIFNKLTKITLGGEGIRLEQKG